VKIISLESRDILPAQTEEVKEALEEGIILLDGAMIESFSSDKTGVLLHCRKVALDQNTPPGVLRPLPLSGTDFTLNVDAVIPAIGQSAEVSALAETVETEGNLVKVNEQKECSQQGYFAGGDLTSMNRFVSEAISAGQRGAISISAYLCDETTKKQVIGTENRRVSFDEINTFYFPHAYRIKNKKLSILERLNGFEEVRTELKQEEIASESMRCFNCGSCQKCDNCFYYCPDMAVQRNSSQNEAYVILDQYCKGCGLCVEECPRGAITLKEERR